MVYVTVGHAPLLNHVLSLSMSSTIVSFALFKPYEGLGIRMGE